MFGHSTLPMQLSSLFFFLYGLIAVDKPTFDVLSPPTGLECEASTGKEKHNHEGEKEKKRQKRKEKIFMPYVI